MENAVEDIPSSRIASYEHRLNELNSTLRGCVNQWKEESEKCYKLVKALCDTRTRIMEENGKSRKKKRENTSEAENTNEDILLYHCDSILRDSEALVETMPKFASIVHRLRQLPPKFAALRVLVNSAPMESPNLLSFTHKRLLSRIDENVEHLSSLIWMFEKEMAFRKNSLWDFALTRSEERRVGKECRN